jgi:hypothetical protein
MKSILTKRREEGGFQGVGRGFSDKDQLFGFQSLGNFFESALFTVTLPNDNFCTAIMRKEILPKRAYSFA